MVTVGQYLNGKGKKGFLVRVVEIVPDGIKVKVIDTTNYKPVSAFSNQVFFVDNKTLKDRYNLPKN